MRGKRTIKKRSIKPVQTLAQLTNKVMRHGEKRKAMKIVFRANQITEEKISLPPLTVLEEALTNAKPS